MSPNNWQYSSVTENRIHLIGYEHQTTIRLYSFSALLFTDAENKPAHIDIMKEQLDNLQKGNQGIEETEVKETTNAIL